MDKSGQAGAFAYGLGQVGINKRLYIATAILPSLITSGAGNIFTDQEQLVEKALEFANLLLKKEAE